MPNNHRVFPTKINELLVNRLKRLQDDSDLADQVEHPGTKGKMREDALREFLVEVFPARYTIADGFICDLMKQCTPQLDIIICDRERVPGFALSEVTTRFVPVESVLMTIEVKSTLKSDDIDQLEKQIRACQRLRPQPPREMKVGAEKRDFVITSFAFAHSSQVSTKTLKEWIATCEHLRGICILGKEYVWSSPKVITSVESDEEYSETLIFLSGLFHDLERISAERWETHPGKYDHWRRYIVGCDPQQMT